jgi:hypothetical protein
MEGRAVSDSGATFAVVVLACIWLGAVIGAGCNGKALHKEAVEAGAGEYYLDGNAAKFRWKTNSVLP